MSKEELNDNDLKTLIGWGLRKQLTWAALFATFLIGLTTSYTTIIKGFKDVGLFSIFLVLFIGLTACYCRLIQCYLFVFTWEEKLEKLKRPLHDEVRLTMGKTPNRLIQIHNGRASLNWKGLILVMSFYVFACAHVIRLAILVLT